MSHSSRRGASLSLLAAMLIGCGAASENAPRTTGGHELGLITLDPGHFHAALLYQQMLPGVSPRVHVYAPLGPDLAGHLNQMARFNGRAENPTAWELEVYAGPGFLKRMLDERSGHAVILSGRNRGKIERVQASIDAGLRVLADKPWIIEAAEFPKLEAALDAAESGGVVAYDAMTQRFEITYLLLRALVNDEAVFGDRVTGSPDEPAVHMESTHYLYKLVSGTPNRRPAWYFDTGQQGEGLTDVGTHLVDLVQWTLLPDQPVDYRRDINIIGARRWPTHLNAAEFSQVTGEPEFPEYLSESVNNRTLEYYCNNTVRYTLKGIHVGLDVRWGYEAEPGAKDTELAVYRGGKSRVEVRKGKPENYRPELYVVPNRAEDRDDVRGAIERKLAELRESYAGIGVEDTANGFHVTVPDRIRAAHEAHFALLTGRFFEYLRNPTALPAWEKSFMLAKYWVTTQGVELARQNTEVKDE